MPDDAQNRKELNVLHEFLAAQCQEITGKSSIGDKLLKGVLTSTMIDLHTAMLLLDGRLPTLQVNQQSWDDYIKHLKRSFILEAWTAVESRVRDVAIERKISSKGRTAALRTYVDEALVSLPADADASEILKKARKMLGGDFVEFPTIQNAVLDSAVSIDRQALKSFLDIFRIMRNAAHDNFRAGQTGMFTCAFLSKNFVKGEPFDVHMLDVMALTQGSRSLFSALHC